MYTCVYIYIYIERERGRERERERERLTYIHTYTYNPPSCPGPGPRAARPGRSIMHLNMYSIVSICHSNIIYSWHNSYAIHVCVIIIY